jgi:hypothetical protein
MAEFRRVLAQSAPAATTLTDILTIAAATECVISSVVVCNRDASATTFRVSVAPNGAADANEQYLYYDVPIPANDTFIATVGITLDATDVIRVYAGNTRLSFNLFGVLIT